MQLSERQVMQSFAFKKTISDTSTAHSSLSETMSLDGDALLISYLNEFEGTNLDPIKAQMRKIKTEFSNEPAFMKDVQIVVDENYLNYFFFNWFESEEIFSLTETLFDYWPEDWMGGPTVIRGLMSVQVWQSLFRNLKGAYDPLQQVDFRCGFGKKYIS